MSNLQEIETKIKQLPNHEIHQLAQWLNNYVDDLWDQQMEIDLAQGKLDQIIAKAEADILENKMSNICCDHFPTPCYTLAIAPATIKWYNFRDKPKKITFYGLTLAEI